MKLHYGKNPKRKQQETDRNMGNKRKTGKAYETIAADYLQAQGYEILHQNYRCRSGEIDLIAREGRYLVFVEVKYRSTDEAGCAASAVDRKKQRTISRVAVFYLIQNQLPENTPCRFDVVAVDGEKITLYKNAFDYQG